VDFSEARDLFVNIFQILGRTAKIPDRGLISENPEGLSAKSAKSGPRVDFPKVQGPLCKISEITNYFLTDNSWTGRASSVHRPPAALVRQSSPAGTQNGEGGTRSSIRASPRLERRRGGRATMMQSGETAALGERVAQVGREGNVSGERCSELWGGCSPFIGAGEQRGGVARAVNAGVNGVNAIEGVKGR
jgi:hypothetical protein